MPMTLKAARVNAGLTQEEAAKAMNVSSSAIGKWEDGTSMPNVKSVLKILEVYHVTFDDLIFLPNDCALSTINETKEV